MEDNKNSGAKKWIILLIAVVIIAIGFFVVSLKYDIKSQTEPGRESLINNSLK